MPDKRFDTTPKGDSLVREHERKTKSGKTTVSAHWRKKGRNTWQSEKFPEFEVQVHKLEGERFYVVDLWWEGHHAGIDGAASRADAEEVV
ncbi:MAG: hypothetical protein ACYTFW_24785, partial [Planctomycetota bacterium]